MTDYLAVYDFCITTTDTTSMWSIHVEGKPIQRTDKEDMKNHWLSMYDFCFKTIYGTSVYNFVCLEIVSSLI